ncbi:transglutaminase domain-containing protein [Candidatus Woesearchaeota archaeon]|jgi:transglutaminase-like putative cysteine protease|nr:transglutaminase domain-containing protein [Candidatus Woesearchaeota archaeon]MBT6518601.1 transglutaminase domain-containing protein [Candidatus Woesearchaeota archaeon]MBT7368759.1 transglutaminase domain-containing protein [Candidatus Woesearchaeota archaeon]
MDKIKNKLKQDLDKKNRRHNRKAKRMSTNILSKLKTTIPPHREITNKSSRRIIDALKEQYKQYNQAILDVGEIRDEYQLLVNDESVRNPFIVSSGLVDIIRNETKNLNSNEKKARRIYDWIEKNIEYGKGLKKYSNSEEVINQRRGVCGEMAFVYVTMARCIGLKSSYVSVRRDYSGKKVHHACAVVRTERGNIFVDPAYHTYDVKHKDYEVLNDVEVLERFNQWRGRE